MNNRSYYVYILANKLRSIYVGITDELVRGVTERLKSQDLTALVYFEECPEMDVAVAREKQIKTWRRFKQVELIESLNPTWADLSSPSLRSG
jgi:putative endonuclease